MKVLEEFRQLSREFRNDKEAMGQWIKEKLEEKDNYWKEKIEKAIPKIYTPNNYGNSFFGARQEGIIDGRNEIIKEIKNNLSK